MSFVLGQAISNTRAPLVGPDGMVLRDAQRILSRSLVFEVNSPNSVQQCNNRVSAASCPGADIGEQINNAKLVLAAISGNGGYIEVPKGKYDWNTAINADNSVGVSIIGHGGQTAGAQAATCLVWHGSGTPLSAKSSTAFTFSGIQVLWDNAAFTGTVVDLSHSGGGGDSTWAKISDCSFFKTGSGGAAGLIISLDKTINSAVINSTFQNCSVAIQGAASSTSYSNAILISHCSFSSSTGTISTAMIQNPAQAWEVSACTFEMGTGAGTPQVIGYANSFTSTNGLAVIGNWIGDSGAGTWSLLNFEGNGLQFIGNYVAGTASTTFLTTINSCFGITVKGNSFNTMSLMFAWGLSNQQIDVSGNSYTSISAFQTGTPSTGWVFNQSNQAFIYGNPLFPGAPVVQGDFWVKNSADAAQYLHIMPGASADQIGGLLFDDFHGTHQWLLEKLSDNNLYLYDVNANVRLKVLNGATVGTNLNGVGTGGVVNFNADAGSGTGGVQFYNGGATPSVVAKVDGSGKGFFNLARVSSLPTYANNAAAVTGGLSAGDLYRTGADPDPVCVVH